MIEGQGNMVTRFGNEYLGGFQRGRYHGLGKLLMNGEQEIIGLWNNGKLYQIISKLDLKESLKEKYG